MYPDGFGAARHWHWWCPQMATAGIIEPSDSLWAALAVLVRKKNGEWRFCIDYRPLNSVTRKDAYSLSHFDKVLDRISGSSWFSSLDLCRGYWQVGMAQSSKAKTAFMIGVKGVDLQQPSVVTNSINCLIYLIEIHCVNWPRCNWLTWPI